MNEQKCRQCGNPENYPLHGPTTFMGPVTGTLHHPFEPEPVEPVETDEESAWNIFETQFRDKGNEQFKTLLAAVLAHGRELGRKEVAKLMEQRCQALRNAIGKQAEAYSSLAGERDALADKVKEQDAQIKVLADADRRWSKTVQGQPDAITKKDGIIAVLKGTINRLEGEVKSLQAANAAHRADLESAMRIDALLFDSLRQIRVHRADLESAIRIDGQLRQEEEQ